MMHDHVFHVDQRPSRTEEISASSSSSPPKNSLGSKPPTARKASLRTTEAPARKPAMAWPGKFGIDRLMGLDAICAQIGSCSAMPTSTLPVISASSGWRSRTSATLPPVWLTGSESVERRLGSQAQWARCPASRGGVLPIW
jgi:hypothetical protein